MHEVHTDESSQTCPKKLCTSPPPQIVWSNLTKPRIEQPFVTHRPQTGWIQIVLQKSSAMGPAQDSQASNDDWDFELLLEIKNM